jgi:hypothetical protein
MCVLRNGDPDCASAVAYTRVLIKELAQEGAPTHAEITDHGEAELFTSPTAASCGSRRAAPDNTKPRDGVITTDPLAQASTVAA